MRAIDRASALKPFWRGGGKNTASLKEGFAHWRRSILTQLTLSFLSNSNSDLGCFIDLNDRVPLTRTKPTKLPSALPTPPDPDNAGKENVTHSAGQPLPP